MLWNDVRLPEQNWFLVGEISNGMKDKLNCWFHNYLLYLCFSGPQDIETDLHPEDL